MPELPKALPREEERGATKDLKTERTDLDILWSRIRSMAGTRPFRSRAWLDGVASMRCVFCREPADDPHHLFGSYGPMKTSDVFTVPVCRRCHDTKAEDPDNRAFLLEKWIQLAMVTIENDHTS